jgi:hypothetical protein
LSKDTKIVGHILSSLNNTMTSTSTKRAHTERATLRKTRMTASTSTPSWRPSALKWIDVNQPPIVRLLANLVQRFVSRQNDLSARIDILTTRITQLESTDKQHAATSQQNTTPLDAEEKEL